MSSLIAFTRTYRYIPICNLLRWHVWLLALWSWNATSFRQNLIHLSLFIALIEPSSSISCMYSRHFKIFRGKTWTIIGVIFLIFLALQTKLVPKKYLLSIYEVPDHFWSNRQATNEISKSFINSDYISYLTQSSLWDRLLLPISIVVVGMKIDYELFKTGC